MSDHAYLSPSAAERWAVCPGSVALVNLCEKQPPGEAAAKGTLCHRIAERVLRDVKLDTSHIQDSVGLVFEVDGHQITYTEQMARWTTMYVEKIWQIKSTMPGSIVYLEQKVFWPGKEAHLGGTLDAALYQEGETLWIGDAKFGRQFVGVTENKQLMLYLVMLIATLEAKYKIKVRAKKFVIAILQPQTEESEYGWCREQELDWNQLVQFVNEMNVAADRILVAKDTTLVPSYKGCKWCPVARGGTHKETRELVMCPKYLGEEVKPWFKALPPEPAALPHVKKEAAFPDPKILSADQISTILTYEKKVVAFIAAVKEWARTQVENGQLSVPGYQLEDVYSNRKWRDPAEAEKFLVAKLANDAYDVSARSPAQAETRLAGKYGKEEAKRMVEALTERSMTGHVLKRNAKDGEDVTEMFSVLD